MQDPVITSDGHTFERVAITQWLQGSNTSPKTGAALPNNNLIPNIALRNRIQDWMQGYSQDMEGGYFDY